MKTGENSVVAPAGIIVVILAPLGCRTLRLDATPPPAPSYTEAAAHGHALHNVIPVTDKLLSGSVPEEDAGFAELRQRGVRTIISVDGAPPDLDLARRHGMRYVHLPIGYHGLTVERQQQLARVIRDLPGPIYLHCHHGRHRGPAAAASAAVVLGALTPEEGTSLLLRAGTSPDYPGLYRCVAQAQPVDAAVLDSVPPEFPEIAPLPSFVVAMAEAQTAYDHLAEIRDAGWRTPARHPDLVPRTEAGRLENLMRAMLTDPENEKYDARFRALMTESHAAATALEAGLLSQQSNTELRQLLSTVNATCKACHVLYRDVR